MTAKTSISPSAQATTVGPEATSPPSDSGSVQAPATCAECQRSRRSSTQNRSRRPGPQVVAASPREGRGERLVLLSVIAGDDTRSSTGTSGVFGPNLAAEGTADGPLGRPDLGALGLGAWVQRTGRGGEEPAQASGAAAEVPAPAGDLGLGGAAEPGHAVELGLLQQVLLVQCCHVGCKGVHVGYLRKRFRWTR